MSSAMEKHVVQIFERKKRIIEQARQQCHLWEHHLFPKLLLNGITPPPWLCNSSLHADPQELNKDDIVSEVLLSQPQCRVPFPGVYSNLDSVSYGGQYPIGLHNEGRALKKDCNVGDGLSSLPDRSINNVVCASSGAPELDSGAVSPQNQIEPGVSDCHHDPTLSLAKLQRSKSRQKALEQRNSAKAPKRLSGEDDNAGVCAGTGAGSALSKEHAMESDVVKDFHSNIQSCSMEDMARFDCVAEKEKSNYSGRITRSKSSSQKFNTLNVGSSSVTKEDGPPPYNLNKSLEIVIQPCFANGSCGVNKANKGESQSKEAGKSVYDERLTKSRSSSQARCNSEVLKLDSTVGSDKGVEICDLMQPITHAELTDLSQASDCNNGSGRNTVKDGNFCRNKLENNIHGMIQFLKSSCPSPGHDLLMTGASDKSIDKSAQSSQPLNSQDPMVSVVGSFSNQKDPDFCAVKTQDRLSRSGSGKVERVMKSSGSSFSERRAICSESAGKKSCNAQPTKLDARRLSSSLKCSKLVIEIGRNSAEKENLAALVDSGNTRAVTTCANEGSLRPVSSPNLDGGSSLAESVFVETMVDEKVLYAQENIPSGAIPTDNVKHSSAAITGEVDADLDGLVQEDPSCVSPKVGLNVSVLKLPSDVIMPVVPKQLDFDDVEETSMNGICSPDMKEGPQKLSTEEEPLNSLEPVNLLEEGISPECQNKNNSSGEMPSIQKQEVLIREEGPQMEYCASHLKEEDIARVTQSAMLPNKEIPMVQNQFCILTSSSMSHSSPSQVAGKNSSKSFSREVMPTKFVSVDSKLKSDESSAKLVDSSSDAVTGSDLPKYTNENFTNFTIGFPFSTPMDDVNVGLAHQAPNSIAFCQDGDLLQKEFLSDGKITGFSTDFQIFRSSTESFTYDVGRSYPQQKRRKIGNETQKCLPASSNLLEKPHDSIDHRSVNRHLTIEDNPEVALEVQHLPSDQEDDIGHQYISNGPTDEMQYHRECQTMEDSTLKVRKEEKLILDGRDRSEDTIVLAVANPSGFSTDLTIRCTMDEKVESQHHQVNSGKENADLLACVERSTSSKRIYPGGNAKFSDGMFATPGMQCLDLVGPDETLPEFEGFIMQTDNVQQPCIAGDEMDLEMMDLPSDSIDYTSLGKSRFMHSPLCNSLTPYKSHDIPELYHQSLPNGLLEGLGISRSLPLRDGSPRSLSDCQPNCKGQYTSSVQTLWDRINSNFGSSGKRKSLKLDLPSITEENENVDETAVTFQRGIDSERMAGSNKREPLAEIVDNTNPSTSVLQDDILTGGLSTDLNHSGTCNKVKNKLDKQDGNRKRFTRKGRENQNISLEANGVKRTTESVHKRPSRPKLSGKDSMKQGPINNIVSNVSSFIPLVQQKQAAAVFTGKRDIKVKALEAAEAAKRMAEKKENERKMKKEVMRLEREKLEMELQKKKKEEERKKKEAQMAAKKRQREDEERKEKEKKRRVNDMKKPQQEHEKIQVKKQEIVIQCRAKGEEVQENKKFMDERENHKNFAGQDKREGNMEKFSETEPLTMRDSANDKTKELRTEYVESVNNCANNEKVMGNLIKATEDDDLIIKNSLQEQSYEVSPYRGSDDEDEDEDEDDMPNNKFIPSWASKHSLSLMISSQKMDPETIFPPQSFCDISQVLLPRKLQLQSRA